MTRRLIRVSQVAIDVCVLGLAFAAAFFIRFDGVPPTPIVGRLLLTGPYVIAFEYLALFAFGVHRFSWRYIGLREVGRILTAVSVAAGVLVLARVAVGQLQASIVYLRHGVIPFGVLGINFVLAFLGVSGVRVLRRIVGERSEKGRAHAAVREVATLLVGAGQGGVLVARELVSRPELGLKAVGFVDDDAGKLGTVIYGIPVLGTTAQIPELVRRQKAEQALITMASAPGSAIRRIRRLCELAKIPTKIIPGLYEIVGGQVNLSRIRNVAIEDLLRREPVELDVDAISAGVRGRVVLATGAGGSIGAELCRQICRFGPAALVLVERAENSLFHIHRELSQNHPEVELFPCIADITDGARMNEIFETHRPAVVLHAAAHKHVPMMEWNPVEALKNNVFGTRAVADLADRYAVEAFVQVSTDKAVNPTSVMGATKRIAEIYVQALSQRSKTRFVTVRFGNVLGSAGSVVPIWEEQLARGGPITVTHPDMRRYFMTIPEACQLVLQAGSMGRGGEIFVLDMGEPVKIVDLARDLIALSGFREGEDVEIAFSGVRPGEKLFEEIATSAEHADKTRHPKIFVGRIVPSTWDEVRGSMSTLERALNERRAGVILRALARAVPEYVPEVDAPASVPPHSEAERAGADAPAPLARAAAQ